jgi:hypothetical protein
MVVNDTDYHGSLPSLKPINTCVLCHNLLSHVRLSFTHSATRQEHIMDPPFRARDAGGRSSRHQHQFSSSASFRRASHTIDMTSPAHDTSRQASLRLNFIIVGAGLSHA